MPPQTEEEVAAEESLDNKLQAFFDSETSAADDNPDDGPAAETEASGESEPEPQAQAVEEQPRDEAGRYLPKFKDPRVAEYIEKFGSLEKALEVAVESHSLVGRQGQELGELRKALEERLGQFEQQQEQRHVASALIQNAIDEARYHEAAQYAAQAGNGVLYNQVMNEWMAVEPYAAYSFDNHLRSAAMAEQLQQQTAPLLQTVQQQKMQQGFQEAMAQFAEGKEDFNQVGPEMLKVAQESPHILRVLENDDPQARVDVLDYLYTKAKGRVSDTLTQAATQAATEAEQQARQAKTQATVGASGTAPTGQPKTNVDQFREEFRKVLFDDTNSLRSGLTAD